MTRQTTAPIAHTGLNISTRTARELVHMLQDGMIDPDPAYQRGSVWNQVLRGSIDRRMPPHWLLS